MSVSYAALTVLFFFLFFYSKKEKNYKHNMADVSVCMCLVCGSTQFYTGTSNEWQVHMIGEKEINTIWRKGKKNVRMENMERKMHVPTH